MNRRNRRAGIVCFAIWRELRGVLQTRLTATAIHQRQVQAVFDDTP
jgi:hypothetical protein